MNQYKSFSIKKVHGVDDLKSIYPYSDEWGTFRPAFNDVTEKWYKQNMDTYKQRVTDWNNQYIEKLKSEGKYLTEYTTHFNFRSYPEFDTPSPQFSDFGILMPKGKLP